MTDAYRKYLELKQSHPELFTVEPDDAYQLVTDDAEAARLGLDATTGVMYADQYHQLLKDPVIRPDGEPGTYLRLLGARDASPGIAVLCRFQGKIVLVDHFRHATRGWMWEIPRGFGDPGCSFADNATREVEEEIQASVVAGTLQRIGLHHANSGISGQRDELAFVEVAELRAFTPNEGIRERRLFAPNEVEAMIRDGAITDGFTLAAYFHAKLRGLV